MAGMAEAGAAAGTAIMPGIGTAIGGIAGAFMDGMGGGSNSASPAGPSSARQSNSYAFDNSGFVVNTGPGSTSAGVASDLPSWVFPALVALGMMVWLKSRKS